jgi:hypothetical protein
VGAGAARRELDTTDVSGERKVGVVEFTDSAHGRASQETRLLGMGKARLALALQRPTELPGSAQFAASSDRQLSPPIMPMSGRRQGSLSDISSILLARCP